MTSLHWVRNDKSPAWILRPVAPFAGGYPDLLTRSTWAHAQPIAEGHPDKASDDALALAYRARWEAAEATKASETPPAKPNRRTGFLFNLFRLR